MLRLVLYEACCDALHWAVVMIASVFNMPLHALQWIKIVALVASHETGGTFFSRCCGNGKRCCHFVLTSCPFLQPALSSRVFMALLWFLGAVFVSFLSSRGCSCEHITDMLIGILIDMPSV